MSTSFDFKSRKREGIMLTFATKGPSMTIQSAKDEVDINNIVARFHRTGDMPENNRQPQYADISDIQQKDPTTALQDARTTITQVQTDYSEFQQLQEQEKQKIYKQQLTQEILKELENKNAQQGQPTGS